MQIEIKLPVAAFSALPRKVYGHIISQVGPPGNKKRLPVESSLLKINVNRLASASEQAEQTAA
jgi:hypothetical protein